MTTLNSIMLLLLFSKKMAASFSEISGEEIQKLEEKAVNKNTLKTTKSWMLSNSKLENRTNVPRDFLPKFAKAMMAPIVSRTV